MLYGKFDSNHIQVLSYVNEVPIIAEDDNDVNGVVRILGSQFTLKYLGRASELVGLAIEYNDQWGVRSSIKPAGYIGAALNMVWSSGRRYRHRWR